MLDVDFVASLPEPDQRLRGKLWKLYRLAEPLAKQFAQTHPWVKIKTVQSIPDGDSRWVPKNDSAEIGIVIKENNPGVLFHEMFHSAFHCSPLHDGGADERWGDAFCNAFRYFMERKLLEGESHWLGGFRQLLAQPAQERPSGDRYKSAATFVVNKPENYGGFRKLWDRLITQKRDSGAVNLCEKRFGYQI